MRGYKLSRKANKRSFAKNAGKTKSVNVKPGLMRGGIRL